jgi:hypothetical protein
MADQQQLLDNTAVSEYQAPTELPANPADVPLESQESDPEAAELTQDRAENGQYKRKGGYLRKIEKEARRADAALAEANYWKARAIREGHGELSDSMPTDEWRAVRDAQVRSGLPDSLRIKAAEIEEPGSEKGDRKAAAESDQDTAKQEPDSAAAYQERMTAFVAQHTDADEVIGRIRMREEVGDAVGRAILEDENGPALAYYLGQHPELWETLSNMEPEAAVDHIAAEVTPKAAALSPKPLTPEEITNHETFIRKISVKAVVDPEFGEAAKAIAATGAPPSLLHFVTLCLKDLDNGDEVLKVIGKNPSLLPTMWRMHPHQAGLMLEDIAAGLRGNREDHAEDSRSTKPPAPINPVSRVGATATGLSDDLPVEEWRRRREAQVQKGARR